MIRKEPIHQWNLPVFIKAFLIGLALETGAFLPGVLSPWGHAGPESLVGSISLLLHLPSLYLVWLISKAFGLEQLSTTAYEICAYSIQTLVLTYVAYAFLQWKKRRGKCDTC
jgi:hypothetical protein